VDAAGLEVGDQPVADRIGEVHEYRRNGAGLFERLRCVHRADDDHVGREGDELSRLTAFGLGVGGRPAYVETVVTAFDPAVRRESLTPGTDACLTLLIAFTTTE